MVLAQTVPPREAEAADAATGARILVVEDERIVAMNLQAKLEGMGYEVAAVAHSGEGAIAAAAEHGPDLVLMDIRLDGAMDGVEAAARIREQYGLPVVFLTAYSTRDIVRRAKVTEPYGYILKPVSDRELHVVVEVALYRHRMEKALHDQKRLLDATLRSIGDGVVATDTESRVTFLNTAAQELTGWTMAEARGRPVEDVLDVVAERTGRPVELPLRRAIRDRAVTPLPPNVVLVARGGTVVPIDDTAAPILGETGALLGGVLVFQDATDRVAAERALRESEERLRLTLAAGRMGTFDWDLRTNAVVWSDTHYELFGYAAGDHGPVTFAHFADRVHPDDRAAAEAELAAARDARRAYRCEHRIVLPDGRVRWIAGSGEFHYDAAGAPVRMLGVVADITDRKAAEASLLLRDRAIQAVTQGIVITDATLSDDPMIYASHGFETLTGYAAAEALGKNCRILHGPDTDPDAVARLQEAVRDRRGCAVEIRNYRKDGTAFWNGVAISPVTDGAGRVTHFVGVMTDVTERRRLEEQFRQAQKMEAVGLLASGVAHDFNNLLTVIGGYSSLILETLPVEDPLREQVVEIREAGERAAHLTRHLLAFSRQQVLEPVVLDANDVIAHAGRLLQRLIGANIAVALDLDPALPPVRVDAGQFEQAILNLAINARDAMPAGGRLTVATRSVDDATGLPPGRYVRLTVADTGCGMTDDVRARIFEPFYTTKPPGQGTGLGLPMVYGFAAQSGGQVTVASAPGAGTTFTLDFPAAAGAAAPPAAEAAPTVPRARPGETVLLVEDDPSVRMFSAAALTMQGYAVLEAESGPDGIAAADAHPGPIDLLLSDVVMPEMGGRQLADALRARRPEMRVLFVSGYLEDSVLLHGVAAGADHFLHKPFTPIALAKKVRAVLDGAA